MKTIGETISDYIQIVGESRKEKTAKAYKYALDAFAATLLSKGIDIDKQDPSALAEEAVAWFASDLKSYAPATEQLYLIALSGFLNYLTAEDLADLNATKIKAIIKLRSRRLGARLPQFPRDEIEQVLSYTQQMHAQPVEDEKERLQLLRDRAFLITLADTGLRVHEACGLRRGDVDWNEGRAILIGKGDKQAVVRFSSRSLQALKDYLNARAAQDGATGRPLPSLPVFARHDKGAGGKTKSITTTTGRNIVKDRVREALGQDSAGRITPHSFRHYFVTTVLVASGGNLKLAQELARHENITNTQRYAHLSDGELDRGYHDIFDQS